MVGTKVYPMYNTNILDALNLHYPSVSKSTDGTRSSTHTHRPFVRMVTRAEYSKPSEYMDMYVKRLREMGREDYLYKLILVT